MNGNWHNASRREPCPICHRPDWCTMSNDGAVCVCRRVESPHPTASGNGWIHPLRGNGESRMRNEESRRRAGPRTGNLQPVVNRRLAALHAGFDGDPVFMSEMIWAELGIYDETLAEKLDVRYNAAKDCMSFPMRNAKGEITGLRYRHRGTGRKWSEKGSKDGLFIPAALIPRPVTGKRQPSPLFICEGPSDTAAALALGLDAIGRSSCMSGTPLIQEYLRLTGIRRVTIVSDGDAPGYDGARRLARALPVSTRILLPPPGIKDLREWGRRLSQSPRAALE